MTDECLGVPGPERPLGFDAHRERVGTSDSGRFNNHLRKLDGPLVEKVDGGYGLTPTGRPSELAVEGWSTFGTYLSGAVPAARRAGAPLSP